MQADGAPRTREELVDRLGDLRQQGIVDTAEEERLCGITRNARDVTEKARLNGYTRRVREDASTPPRLLREAARTWVVGTVKQPA